MSDTPADVAESPFAPGAPGAPVAPSEPSEPSEPPPIARPEQVQQLQEALSVVDEAATAATAASPATHPARTLPRVLAITNQKGGVGKTTTAVNLGAALADLGHRTLVVDLDPQGNASTGLGINVRDLDVSMYDVMLHDRPMEDCIEATSVRNLFVAPASLDLAGAEIELVPAFSRELRLRRALDEVRDDYDFVLIDCPPSLGLLTVNGLAAAGEVLVPIQCEYYALEGLGQLLRNVDLVQRNLNRSSELSTIVLVMYDARTKLSAQVVDRGARALRRQGVPHDHSSNRAALRGSVVRPADHGVRSRRPGGDRLPGAGQGGERCRRDAAGWVGDCRRSYPATPPGRRRTRRCSSSRSPTSCPTAISRGRPLTRTPSPP